ncbi:NAD(P)H-dependent oxidoreductase subunit E [Croceicoccus naphthovorans]|uniref:ATP synthase subunit E n=1 Tax=Croceicoccus naphthovorans TaxID=1348774 RepID=A0A0G3XFC0_9SPHN|nr:NAD(P)H-dependent oxidoreductase subunit E [Croceicoccus naphthovorans]AKM10220.1 ATP synthase subunit E [Croceicoccus naphthovorans]MBB3990524.1 formate dehydrogenase subunit gamma [Croceicoccus naphthovorans]
MNRIEDIVLRHADREGPLLPILHDVQAEIGAVDAATETRIAELLNLTRAEVHGVVSFYHDFTAKADPRPVVQVCRAEACQARGIEAMMRGAENAAGDRVRIETVYCLGLCSVGPNARIGDDLHARLDSDALAKLVEEA